MQSCSSTFFTFNLLKIQYCNIRINNERAHTIEKNSQEDHKKHLFTYFAVVDVVGAAVVDVVEDSLLGAGEEVGAAVGPATSVQFITAVPFTITVSLIGT